MQSTAGDANNYPSGYHTNTGYMAFELSHISYHMAPEHAMLLQGTPRCSRVLHCSIGCYSTAADTTSTAGDAIYCRGCNLSTAGDANNYPSGYHTNTGYMAFELSHISYHMAPEHAMLLQGTPRCSRVLHCSIGCYSTAADTTSTAGDAIYCRGCNLLQGMQSAGDANNYPSGYHTNTGYMAFELSHISYHMAPEHVICCSRVLHVAPGYSIGPYVSMFAPGYSLLQRIPHLLQGMQSTAGDAIYCRGCKQLPQRIPH